MGVEALAVRVRDGLRAGGRFRRGDEAEGRQDGEGAGAAQAPEDVPGIHAATLAKETFAGGLFRPAPAPALPDFQARGRGLAVSSGAVRSAPVCFALACLVVVLAWGAPRTAAAAEVDGRYVQGPLVEEYSVREWRSACGPAPQSTTTPGGETVEIRTEGDEIAIVGGGRVFRSSECYDAMLTLVRESHSRIRGRSSGARAARRAPTIHGGPCSRRSSR